VVEADQGRVFTICKHLSPCAYRVNNETTPVFVEERGRPYKDTGEVEVGFLLPLTPTPHFGRHASAHPTETRVTFAF
jgi:hypothetical protein